MCEHTFYSLGEQQLWVFCEISSTDGREMTMLVYFFPFFAVARVCFGQFQCRGEDTRRLSEGRIDPLGGPKSIYRHQKLIWGRFGKVTFWTSYKTIFAILALDREISARQGRP